MRLLLGLFLIAVTVTGCGATDTPVAVPAAVKAPPQTARLGWEEPYPAAKAALVFGVSSFTVTRSGWAADLSVENTSQVGWEVGDPAKVAARAFGVLLFPNDDLDELDRRNRAGDLPAIRPAASFTPALPARAPAGTDLEGHDCRTRPSRRRPLGPDLLRPLHERRRPAGRRSAAGGLVHGPRTSTRRGRRRAGLTSSRVARCAAGCP